MSREPLDALIEAVGDSVNKTLAEKYERLKERVEELQEERDYWKGLYERYKHPAPNGTCRICKHWESPQLCSARLGERGSICGMCHLGPSEHSKQADDWCSKYVPRYR
jgi:predicted metal-dependent hydrolase